MKVAVKNIEGKEVKQVDLPDDVFAVEMNEGLLHTVCRVYRSNLQQGTHHTKTRAFVSGGGAKPLRQKGSGNARQGTTRSPHHEGGAISHGPQTRSHRKTLNRATRVAALKVALSDKVRHGQLHVVDDFKVSSYSTKHIVSAMKHLGVNGGLLSDQRKDNYLYRSCRNIYQTIAKNPEELTAEDVIRYRSLVISETALATLQGRIKGEKTNA